MGNVKSFFKSMQMSISKHSPEILTGIGIAGMVVTTVMAVKATPKALALIEEAGYKKGSDENPIEDMEYTPLTAVETVKVAWKPYIPAAITCSLSIACILGARSMNAKRNAALATAYTLSETALREYKDKVVEALGEKKEQAIQDAVAKDRIDKKPVSSNEVIITEKGNTLCFDSISGRYFKSDIDSLKKAVNELNRQMLSDGYISLNDFYYEIGLSNTKIGDDLGWNSDRGLIDLNFSSQLAEDGTPCLVLNFSVAPKYDY